MLNLKFISNKHKLREHIGSPFNKEYTCPKSLNYLSGEVHGHLKPTLIKKGSRRGACCLGGSVFNAGNHMPSILRYGSHIAEVS